MKSIWQFVVSLLSKPRYRDDPSYIDWVRRSEAVPGALPPDRAAEAVEYAWKSYDESRELFFKSEAKRDDFLKFTSALIAFLGAALGTGRFTWSIWLAGALTLPVLGAVILVLSRRSISLPGLPDVIEIRAHLRIDSVKGEWMARNIGGAREAILALNPIRARQLNAAIWLVVAGLICLAIWALTTAPAAPAKPTSSEAGAPSCSHPAGVK